MTDMVGTIKVRRPSAVRVIFWLLILLGLSGVTGGIELVGGIGAGAAMPPEWLHRLPLVGGQLNSWLVPGLVLGLGFGVAPLVAAYGLLSRRWIGFGWVERLTGYHWSWLATIVIGAGQAFWILLEVLYIPEKSWLQVIYGPLGLVLAILPFRSSVRRYSQVGDGRRPAGAALRAASPT